MANCLKPETQSPKDENKPLAQRLGSKVGQKVKTETKTQHESHLFYHENVLKRTKSKALSKIIS